MKIAQCGIILFVEKYDECVAFYRDIVTLDVEYTKESLTNFCFGSAYLMVEKGGNSASNEKRRTENPTVLRFNVADLETAALALEAKGVEVKRYSYDWGRIGVFTDPDGNRCELKSAP